MCKCIVSVIVNTKTVALKPELDFSNVQIQIQIQIQKPDYATGKWTISPTITKADPAPAYRPPPPV